MYDYVKFHKGYYEAIEDLDDLSQLVIYKAIIKYGLYQEEPELSGISKTIWKIIKPLIDGNHANVNNGKKGGRPPKDKPTDTKPPKEEKKAPEPTKKIDEVTEYAHKKASWLKNFWNAYGNCNVLIDDEHIFFDEENKAILISGSDKKPKKDLKYYQDKVFNGDYVDD